MSRCSEDTEAERPRDPDLPEVTPLKWGWGLGCPHSLDLYCVDSGVGEGGPQPLLSGQLAALGPRCCSLMEGRGQCVS